MAYYGYHRISTKEQHLDRGIIEIKRFCENQKIKLESIFTDKITGKNFDRPRYTVLVEDVLRVGDTLIITELDRLGRNKQEILKQLRFLESVSDDTLRNYLDFANAYAANTTTKEGALAAMADRAEMDEWMKTLKK